MAGPPYHSLQIKVVKRHAHGLTMLASYTWSKLISNANASDAPIGVSDQTTVQNYYNLPRGAVGLGARHTAVVHPECHL